tara:strand:+ start:98 stop:1177 length:1080 start_codon:yes stop_codon:yes gene_type:complete
MAISPDVLASALQELMPGYSELFVKWHPILDRIVDKGNIDRSVATGPYREFAVVTDGPGTVTQILTGSEVIAGGRRQNAVRGNTFAPRLIYAFDVPGKDLAEANGAMDLARIIQHYPELALSDFHERIARQVAVGDGLDVGGFMTLNGSATYNPNGVARNGPLEFLSQAGQIAAANTVFGLSKGTTSGWYNQFGNITSFATNGRSTMRQVYFAAGRQGKTMGPVDLMLGDEASYLNYIEDLDDHVRISKVEGERSPSNIRQGVKFLDADFFLEDALDITAANFAGTPAANGCIYLLKSASWYAYTMGQDANRETKGDFAVRGPFRIPEQDVFRYEIVLNMGMNTNQLRCNGVVTGGALP